MSEEALSPPIHPGRAGPSVGGLSAHCRAPPTAGLSQWRSTVLMFVAERAHTGACAQGFDLSTDASILGPLFLVMWAPHG